MVGKAIEPGSDAMHVRSVKAGKRGKRRGQGCIPRTGRPAFTSKGGSDVLRPDAAMARAVGRHDVPDVATGEKKVRGLCKIPRLRIR